jgi:predicted transposase YdaD
MAKMRIEPKDRPKVKAECLRLLATLKLDPARTQLFSGFVDTYLRLNAQEKRVFEAEIGKLEETQKEGIMQIVTSWAEEAERSLILRQLTRRVGQLPETILAQVNELPIEQLEALGEALLDFADLSDLQAWLASEVR